MNDAEQIEETPVRAASRQEIFRREGEYWTIEFDGAVVRLRDSLGLHYLAQLLARPGCEIASTELAASGRVQTGGVGADPAAACHDAPFSALCSAAGDDDRDRVRSAVTKRIKDALRRICVAHPALGQHLTAGIKTGYRCVYRPIPERAVRWLLS